MITCGFNSPELLAQRRKSACDPTISLENAYRTICEIDRLRMAHEEATGCKCWYEALKAAGQEIH